MKIILCFASLTSMFLLTWGCSVSELGNDLGKNLEVNAATVIVTMENQTVTNAPFRPFSVSGTQATPSTMQFRLKNIYLVEDQPTATEESGWIGNNSGQAIFIWEAPDCPTKKDADCATMAYFDFNLPSEQVNANLASQEVRVVAGTYRFIKLGLLGDQAGGGNSLLNAKWADAVSGTTEQEFATVKTEWGAKFETPLVIAEGDSISVTLGYTLIGTIFRNSMMNEMVRGQGTYQPGSADDCAGDVKPWTCFTVPSIVVSAAKK